ncbi:MAG: UvrD-helicase domain-containing protein, partial [Bacteroidales bacterium]|nr:UvrD-helicase domain-containing protein [Bacteroidales bacterium]
MNDVLNYEQKAALECTEGTIRVVAGAGSGKTRTLVHRYAMLLNEMGIPQSDILCMTFTNKAAQEMKTRIAQMCPGGAAGDFVTTIHGFCVRFLRVEIYRLGYPQNFLIFDEEDNKSMIKEVLEENGIERKNGIVGNFLEELASFKAATPYIPRYILPPLQIPASDIPLFGKMILRQKRYNALDFDDLMFFTLHILNNFPEVRKRWQEQFQYVMVDEVQDCSKVEWELFTILSGHYGNLFIVGDGDQAIYEWRGAHPEIFTRYNPEHEFYLKRNYRSTPNIVCVADCIIKNNKNRLPRTSVTMRPADGARTKFYHCKNERQEAGTLARELKRSGRDWKDIAVLYRATYLSRSIEQTFIREKIPYVVWGGVRFFERKEIKDALAYLRLVAMDDEMSFTRIANVPSRKIGKKTMAFLKGYASSMGCSLLEAL